MQIQYTSGTTGFPKGAIIRHRGITNNARLHYAISGVVEGETALNFMPLFHTASCGLSALGSAQFGCAMVLARMFDAPAMLDLIERERVNVVLGVPTMFVGLIEAHAPTILRESALARSDRLCRRLRFRSEIHRATESSSLVRSVKFALAAMP